MSRQRLHNDQHGALESKGNAAHQKRQTPQTLNQFLQLQQTRGNQLVQRLLAEGRFSSNNHPVQAKLTVGAPGSVHEQEADHVAQQVMNMPDKAVQREETLEDEQLVQTQLVQREETLDDEEMVQTQLVQREETLEDEQLVQTQLVQREETLDDEEMVQAKFVQREETLDDETLQAKSDVQVPEVTSDVETLIEQKRGGGRPLPDSAREFFEPRFGQDFSGVNVHTDAQADSLNHDLQARAFATGSDIFFRSGEYQPDSTGGRELLAHELTHVVQQGAATQISREAVTGESTELSHSKYRGIKHNNPANEKITDSDKKAQTYSLVIAAHNLRDVSEPMAITLLQQSLTSLWNEKNRVYLSHEAWIKAQKQMGHQHQYMSLKNWRPVNSALISANIAITNKKINEAQSQLQAAERLIKDIEEHYKTRLVDSELLDFTENYVVGSLEVIKKICFTLLGEEYPFLAPVIEAFASELGESLAGVQDDKTSKELANRLPEIFSGLLGSLDKSIGHEAGLVKGIFDEFVLAGTNILDDVKNAEVARKGKKLPLSEMTPIILKALGLAAVGIGTKLSKNPIYNALGVKH